MLKSLVICTTRFPFLAISKCISLVLVRRLRYRCHLGGPDDQILTRSAPNSAALRIYDSEALHVRGQCSGQDNARTMPWGFSEVAIVSIRMNESGWNMGSTFTLY
jgi:hypothetical protein